MTTVSEHVVTATLVVGASTYPLKVKSGTVTLDDSWSPYAQASIEVTVPALATLALIDPRQAVRVTVTATCTYLLGGPVSSTTRTFDLGLRGREVNYPAATLTLTLESDEAIMRDYVWTNTAPLPLFAYQATGLQDLVANWGLFQIGATLEAGAGDADINVWQTKTNMFVNPRAQISTANVGASNATLTRSTTTIGGGATSFVLGSPSSTDAYMYVGGDLGALRNGMTGGNTYTASGDIYLSAAQTGTLHTDARRIVLYYRDAAGTLVKVRSDQAGNISGVQRVTFTFTLPPGVTEAALRFYHGATAGGVLNWTNLRLSEGDGNTVFDTDYFDGDSLTFGVDFAYTWTGATGLSTSVRTALHGRSEDLLWLMPGQSMWEFLYAIVQASGLRLFCDANRKWRLVPTSYTVSGTTTITTGDNLTSSGESISRDDGTWFDAVLIKYTWTDAAGVTNTAYDRAVTPGYTRVKVIEYNHQPSPGQGGAALVLARARGLEPVLDIEAVSDYRAEPSQALSATLPGDTSARSLIISAVTFNLQNHEMRVASRPVP